MSSPLKFPTRRLNLIIKAKRHTGGAQGDVLGVIVLGCESLPSASMLTTLSMMGG
jgi:hypothetical protein